MPARTPPTTTDLAAARAFERARRVAASERVVAHPLGVQTIHEALRHAFVMNLLHTEARLPSSLDAEGLRAELDVLQAGMAHRCAYVCDPTAGERMAADLRRDGWHVERDVFMALRRARDREPEPGVADEVGETALRAIELEAIREHRPRAGEVEVRHVLGARAALCATCTTRHFAAGGAAVATLYSDGAVAQIEDVATLRAHRGRGLARATVSAAVEAALAMGHELIFIVADDEDWPKDLYAKLGFNPMGIAHTFTRLPPPG